MARPQELRFRIGLGFSAFLDLRVVVAAVGCSIDWWCYLNSLGLFLVPFSPTVKK